MTDLHEPWWRDLSALDPHEHDVVFGHLSESGVEFVLFDDLLEVTELERAFLDALDDGGAEIVALERAAQL